ncbi:MAG: ornithine cyclodeaminase family protein [Deltaproteobacteria bacterium]|nr:ornithine cyclodeaminase family protein [Deltaproteobacteria bacterium]
MKVKILSKDQIASLGLTMSEIMAALEEGWCLRATEKVELPAKIGVHPRTDCYIHAMPCFVPKLDMALIKWAAGYPPNLKKGLAYINGLIVVNNPETGLTEFIMDSAWVTAWRTGAAAGVCACYMGGETAEVAAIIGTGVQGITTGIAFGEAAPKLKKMKIYDLLPSQMDRFTKTVGRYLPDMEFVNCQSVEDCVKDADLISTCVPIVEKPNRFLTKGLIKPDALVIASDYDSAVSEEIMLSGPFVCDDRNQYLETQSWGTYFQNGYPREKDLYADMAEMCAGLKPKVKGAVRGAVLMGIAVHDVMTVKLILEKLKTVDIGQYVEI